MKRNESKSLKKIFNTHSTLISTHNNNNTVKKGIKSEVYTGTIVSLSVEGPQSIQPWSTFQGPSSPQPGEYPTTA